MRAQRAPISLISILWQEKNLRLYLGSLLMWTWVWVRSKRTRAERGRAA